MSRSIPAFLHSVRRRFVGAASSAGLLTICAALSLGADFCGMSMHLLAGSHGKLQNYMFSVYTSEADFGIPIPELAAGGAQVPVQPSRLGTGVPAFTAVKTSNAAILTATLQGEIVTLKSAAPGTAELSLLDEKGAVVESIDVLVKPTTRVQRLFLEDSVLLEGGVAREQFQTYSDGTPTYCGGALRASYTGRLQAPGQPPAVPLHRNDLLPCSVLLTGAAGTGTVTASSVEGQSASSSWTVIPAIDAGTVTLSNVTQTSTVDFGKAVDFRLSASAQSTSAQRIAGPHCTWTASSPAVTFIRPVPANGYLAEDVIGVTTTQPGAFSVTCTIGSAASSIALGR